jgi:hypothetical protein
MNILRVCTRERNEKERVYVRHSCNIIEIPIHTYITKNDEIMIFFFLVKCRASF